MMYDWTSMGAIACGVSDWSIPLVNNLTNFALNTTFTTAEYDALLIAWEAQSHQTGVTAHFGGSTYTTGGAAETARPALTNPGGDNWTITDGGAA